MNQQTVVLAGAGTMGASLAQVYAQAGYRTILHNRSQKGLQRARGLISLNQETMVRSKLLTQEVSAALQQRIEMTTDPDAYQEACLVVESIVEDLHAKHGFWSRISRLVPEEALLASNTSGLHLTDIAAAVHRPERFIGQHWLNPPHLLPLCELVCGRETSQETLARMKALVEGRLGKKAVVVSDINGFLINRIQFAVLREALYIVESGAATAEDIDKVMKYGLGLRYAALGPFGVADFGGLDTFDHISSYLFADLSRQQSGNALLHGLVERGNLGVKSGAGFYDYSGGRAAEATRQRDALYIELAKTLYFGKEERDEK